MKIVSNFTTNHSHMISDGRNQQGIQSDQLFCPRIFCKVVIEWLCGQLYQLAAKYLYSIYNLNSPKMIQEFVHYFCEFAVCVKLTQVIVALIAYNTPTYCLVMIPHISLGYLITMFFEYLHGILSNLTYKISLHWFDFTTINCFPKPVTGPYTSCKSFPEGFSQHVERWGLLNNSSIL
jgi:hypothetical protein